MMCRDAIYKDKEWKERYYRACKDLNNLDKLAEFLDEYIQKHTYFKVKEIARKCIIDKLGIYLTKGMVNLNYHGYISDRLRNQFGWIIRREIKKGNIVKFNSRTYKRVKMVN